MVVYGFSALALVGFVWWETAALLDRQVEVAIAADAQGLAERWREGGTPALVSTIRQRLAENVDDDAIYLVVDQAGEMVTGNLESWPQGVTEPDAWYELPIERAGVRSLARVRRFDLPGGYHLLVGRDVRTRAQLRRLLTDALFWALFIVGGLGVAGALLLRSVFRRMVANVAVTADAIAAGDLTQRVRLSGRDDEFDRLAEAVNEMLDRIARLMDGVRQVSNAIAHDLRTPIARARARLEDAVLHAKGEEDLHAAIERATADLDGVTAVFQALLRIAEIEAGARRSAFGPVDLAPLLADLADLYGAVAEDQGLRLELSGARGPADRGRPRARAAGSGEPARQCGEVRAARRRGPAGGLGARGMRCTSPSPIAGRGSRRRTASGRRSASIAARPRAARRARVSASRSCRRSPSCMAACCGSRTTRRGCWPC